MKDKKKNKKKKPVNKKSAKNRKGKKSILAQLKENKAFTIVIMILIISFMWLVTLNKPVTETDKKGINFLNEYEFPKYLVKTGNCMYPYDVGDGVITFGPGITYKTIDLGIEAINSELNTDYSRDNSCIKVSDLMQMQKNVLVKYEHIVIKVENDYGVSFTQDQFNALVLLSYNSPNLFKDTQFLHVIIDPESTYKQYVQTADNYYRQLRGYDTDFGVGWYNRIKDSAEMFYFGDYKYQNNLEA